MKILVGCEFSQKVTNEFRKRGHEAYSCDILDCEGGHPEWHIKGNILDVLDYGWDMLIAFPPCTHLAVSGARHFEKKRNSGVQKEAIEFFMTLYHANIERIAIENPVGIISGDYIKKYYPELIDKYNLPIKPSQIIHPWMFGDNTTKATCLWLKNLPSLIPIIKSKPDIKYVNLNNGNRETEFMYKLSKLSFKERGKARSITFDGIAKAMANQWG